MAYTSGLAKAASDLGGRLFDHSPVTGLERQGQRWSVQTERGAVNAEQVVLASNAYTEGEWTDLRRNFFPGYYYQVASKPLTDATAQRILPGGQGSWDTRQVLSSIRRDADGRLLLGSLGNGNQKARLVPQGLGRPRAAALLPVFERRGVGMHLDGMYCIHPRSLDAFI
jgi:glycine/D-amino acid oxidase-like deaminating enzyme